MSGITVHRSAHKAIEALHHLHRTQQIFDDVASYQNNHGEILDACRETTSLLQTIDTRVGVERAKDALLESCARLEVAIDAGRAPGTLAPPDEVTLASAVYAAGTDVASTLIVSSILDLASSSAVLLAPHLSYWRQRDGPTSILLSLFGPLRPYIHGHALLHASRIADMMEAGPYDWLVAGYWGYREICKAMIRKALKVDTRVKHAWGQGTAHASSLLHQRLSRAWQYMCRYLPLEGAKRALERQLLWAARLFHLVPPSLDGSGSPGATSHAIDGSRSIQDGADGAHSKQALPAWLQPSSAPARLRSPAAKAEALLALQRPLHTLAGLAAETLSALAVCTDAEGVAAVIGREGPIFSLMLGSSGATPVDDASGGVGVAEPPSPAANIRRGEALRALSDRVAALPALVELAARPYAARPSLQRNWALWLALCGAGYAGIIHGPRRAADAAAWLRETSHAIGGFYKEHLRTPLSRMAGEVLGTEPLPHVADAAALEVSKDSLAKMLADFHARVDVSILPEGLRSQQALSAAAAQLDMRPVTEAFTLQVRSPVRSAVGGDLLELMLIQIAFLKKEVLSATSALDEILRENRFNFQMAALLPALLLLWGASRGAGAVYSAATAPIDTGNVRARMRLALHDAHRLLTLADGQAHCDCGGAGSPAGSGRVNAPVSISDDARERMRAFLASLESPTTASYRDRASSSSSSSVESAPASPTGSSLAYHRAIGGSGLGLEQSGALVVIQRHLWELLTSYRRSHAIGWEHWARLSEDVADLSNASLSPRQRASAVLRMQSTFGFLAAGSGANGLTGLL